MTIDEINKERAKLQEKLKKLDTEEEKIKEVERQDKRKQTQKLVNLMREHKDLVLAMFPKHSRTSCSDEDVCNGFYSCEGHYRCKRCAILEILDGDDLTGIEVSFGIDFHEIQKGTKYDTEEDVQRALQILEWKKDPIFGKLFGAVQ